MRYTRKKKKKKRNGEYKSYQRIFLHLSPSNATEQRTSAKTLSQIKNTTTYEPIDLSQLKSS